MEPKVHYRFKSVDTRHLTAHPTVTFYIPFTRLLARLRDKKNSTRPYIYKIAVNYDNICPHKIRDITYPSPTDDHSLQFRRKLSTMNI
jgi:hypothetical protein